jgi:hypothetical protein
VLQFPALDLSSENTCRRIRATTVHSNRITRCSNSRVIKLLLFPSQASTSHIQTQIPPRIQLCRWGLVFPRRFEGTYCFHLQRMGPTNKNSCAPQPSDTASYPQKTRILDKTAVRTTHLTFSYTFLQRWRRLEVETSKIRHCASHTALVQKGYKDWRLLRVLPIDVISPLCRNVTSIAAQQNKTF